MFPSLLWPSSSSLVVNVIFTSIVDLVFVDIFASGFRGSDAVAEADDAEEHFEVDVSADGTLGQDLVYPRLGDLQVVDQVVGAEEASCLRSDEEPAPHAG